MTGSNAERVTNIKAELHRDAQAISERYNGAPLVIVVAGSESAKVPATITAFSNLGEGREGRMRDQLGILQASIQIEALDHILGSHLNQYDIRIRKIAEAVKKIAEATNTAVDL